MSPILKLNFRTEISARIYSTVRLTMSLRRRGYGQAPAGVRLRLPPVGRNSLPHRPLIVKRLSRHKARRGILHSFRHESFCDAQDEKCKQFANCVKKAIVFLKRHRKDSQIVNIKWFFVRKSLSDQRTEKYKLGDFHQVSFLRAGLCLDPSALNSLA